MSLFDELKEKLKGKGLRVVFPEGEEKRIQGAAVRLLQEEILKPILLGNKEEIEANAKKNGFDLSGMDIIDPETYEGFDDMVSSFVERRKGKATEEQAREILKDVNYFGTMLVYLDQAEALVSGAVHSTADTVRPALQIIKTKEGVRSVSGAFLMLRGEERYLFADNAINILPNEEVLAEIGLQSGETAKKFGIAPDIAFLSFSSKGSGKSPDVERVAKATQMAKENAPEDFNIDGELQFDAAFVPEVAELKAPDSPVAGHAKVFIFPEIQSGNIGYKIAQRLGGFEAIGPILQGMAKPVSDLSRGSNEEDVYKVAIITANQAL